VRKGDDLTTFIAPKVEKIWSLNLRIPEGLFRPVAGKLYLSPFINEITFTRYNRIYTHTHTHQGLGIYKLIAMLSPFTHLSFLAIFCGHRAIRKPCDPATVTEMEICGEATGQEGSQSVLKLFFLTCRFSN
jgi:hypothetical protein